MRIIAVIYILLHFNSLSQKDLVLWSEELDSTFSWDLYSKGTILGEFEALTAIELSFDCTPNTSGQVTVRLEVFMNKRKSYYDKNIYKKEFPSQALLAHEKLHFDIYEYYKRLFFKRVSSLKAKKNNVLVKKINKEYDVIKKEIRSLQDKYDNETNFSRNIAVQEKWQIEIKEKLNQLKEFSGTEITVSIKT